MRFVKELNLKVHLWEKHDLFLMPSSQVGEYCLLPHNYHITKQTQKFRILKCKFEKTRRRKYLLKQYIIRKKEY